MHSDAFMRVRGRGSGNNVGWDGRRELLPISGLKERFEK